ncbi:hypothetical protein NP493_216g02035 [Ridgeia piscesae]|uniref:PEST proteolytic signal-containing nuclear protein n=1 Tax=Ridgeia piscesae TaxID=27915 RepID=A0AAD9UE62_RIDPI|nr:hypothetical protein NP493_216g02035 [Ridgeia piscesae]
MAEKEPSAETRLKSNCRTVDTGGGGEGSHSTDPAHQHAGDKRRSAENSSDEPAAKKSSKVTQPLKKPGIAFSLSGTKVETAKKPAPPIKLKLGERKELPSLPKASATVSSVFNDDDDSDEDEMPAVAKMRMKNIGRDTPTAAGPNSFGKGRLGFCNRQQSIQKELGTADADK